jgi:hypothetical protein
MRAVVAVSVALGAMLAVLGTGHRASAATASPLLFGENLLLSNGSAGSDPFLIDPALRAGLVNAGVQTIRLPVRGTNPNDPTVGGIGNLPEVEQALSLIKSLNLTPLIILRNPLDPTLLADDTTVVDYANGLFGSAPVYYEFGNETDLPGSAGNVSASFYVSKWNATVPSLKAAANAGAQFIGPVNYQYDSAYLQTFLASANPLPDAVSWHTYTCDPATTSRATCIANIDHWTTNFDAARTLMTNTIGKQLPIWDTEWNYTAQSDVSDYTDAAFLEQWTTKAIQTLAADGIAASMHYNTQNSTYVPLVNSDGSLAPEGVAFNAQYTALIGSGATSSASASASSSASSSASASPSGASSASPSASASPSPSASPSASASPSPSASATATAGAPKYSFEDGTLDGWEFSGHVTKLANSNDVPGQDGTHELEVGFDSTGSGDFPNIHVNPAGGPTAGQTLTAYVYIPSSTTTAVTAKFYVQDSAFKWYQVGNAGTLITQRGSWVQISYTPTGYSGNAIQVGIQLQESGPYNTASTVYVDSIAWS